MREDTGELLRPLFSLSASKPCSNVELLIAELGHDTQKEKRLSRKLWIAYINLYDFYVQRALCLYHELQHAVDDGCRQHKTVKKDPIYNCV